MLLFRKTLIFLLCLMTLQAFASANLIMNGKFKVENESFPPYWMFKNNGGVIEYFKSGGPDNQPFVRLKSQGKITRLQQNNLQLVKGEKYKLGAWFRTKNVKGKMSGIRAGSGSFAKIGGNCLFGLPGNLPEWKYFEKIIVLDKEEKALYSYYTVDIVLEEGGGELDVAGVSLIPVTEKSKRNSFSQLDIMKPCLVPLNLLYYIPVDKPELDFFWVGKLNGDTKNLDCKFTFSKNKKTKTVPFSRKSFTVDFNGFIVPGEQQMTIQIISRSSKTVLYSENFMVRGVVIPKPASTSLKVLNNLVTEVFNEKTTDGMKINVSNPRFGWMFFKYTPESMDDFEIKLDNKVIITPKSFRPEAVRLLDIGKYTVSIKGAKGNLTVRLIPDILTFALQSSIAPGNGRYDWDFAKKYILPALTTLNVSGLSKTELLELKSMGLIYLANYGIQNWNTPNIPEETLERMERSKVFQDPSNDGTTMDEAECWYPLMLDPYAYALKHFDNRYNKLIVTYMTGPVSRSYCNVISAAANASKSRGWMEFEVYNREQPTEQTAKAYLRQMCQLRNIFRDTAPGLLGSAGVIFGNFSVHPHISLAHYPDVNYKYFLDMQLFLLANDPAFKGVEKTGFWGTYMADEEIVRWCFRLMRHYAIEGNKDMLSKRYGYKYSQNYINNSNFEEKFSSWKTQGPVYTETFPEYGKNNLRFHGAHKGTGDTFAVLPRTQTEHAELIQTAEGLQEGKVYRLYFYVGDYNDIINNIFKPGRLPVEVKLDGAEIINQTCYTGYRKSKFACINTHKIIFRAKKTNVKLTFSNKKAMPGTSFVLNYVSLQPYFEKEKFK